MKRYKEYRNSGVQWIGKVPEHWVVSRLKYFCEPLKSGGTPKSDDSRFYAAEGTPWVAIADMSSTPLVIDTAKHLTEEGIADKNLNIFPSGTILYSIYATLGKVSELAVPACINQAILAINPDKRYCKTYFKYCLAAQEQYVYSLSNGNTQNNLNAEKVANFFIVLPPLIEQQVIASFLEAKTKPIDDIIAKREKQIELLEEMKSAIISRAVTKGLNSEAKMKDSGLEWIGEIPDHWDVKCIKYIKANVPNAFVDGPFGSNLKSQHYVEDGDVYVIESGFITSGKFEYVRDMKTITEEHFETIKRSECKENDIIIAKIGAYFGMAAVLPKLDKKSVVSGNSLKITLDNTIMLNDIFVYLMACSKKQNGYIGVVNETAQPALSLYNLNHFKLPVAPLEEQEAIASYLDSETSKIDTRIAKRRKQIELLQEYKQALITAAVTGKIDVREYNS